MAGSARTTANPKTKAIATNQPLGNSASCEPNLYPIGINPTFTEVKNILNRGKNITLLCKETTEYFKNLLLIQSGVKDINVLNIMPNELSLLEQQANKLDSAVLRQGFDKFARIELDLKYSANPQNLFEAVCISLITMQGQNKATVNTQISQPTMQPAFQPVQPKVIAAQPEPVKPVDDIFSNKVDTSANTISNEINKLWGSVLLEIKKRNMFALSSLLKDIYGVHLMGNCLVLLTNDQTILKSVDEPERLNVILSIAATFSDKIKKVEIKYDDSNKSSRDIVAELKNVFMDKLKIKE